MCQSSSQGGKRCYDHGAGASARKAMTGYAQALSDLDSDQVNSIYSRIKRDGKRLGGDKPSEQETEAFLAAKRRDIALDPRLDDDTRAKLAAHLDQAIEDTKNGNGPDAATLHAWKHTAVEAEIASVRLSRTLSASARARGISEGQAAIQFENWRGRSNYEDIESPDPAFRLTDPYLPTDKKTQRALRKVGFENYLAQEEPVFVYGTLRTGQGNQRVLRDEGVETKVVGRMDGVSLYGPNRGFPYGTESPDGQGYAIGEMVTLKKDQHGRGVRFGLDRLEGFDSDNFSTSHYYRELRDVTYTDASGQEQTKKAWVYLAGSWAREGLSESERIHDGDWVKAREAAYRPSVRARYAPYNPPSNEASAPVHSAKDSAAAFMAAFADEDDEPLDEHAAFWAANNA